MANDRAAVFSDVEGTLIDASLPRISIQVGRRIGLFSRGKVLELGLISTLSKLAPAKWKRRARYFVIQRAMAGSTREEVARLCEATLPEVMPHLKTGNWARVREHAEAGMPVVLISAGLHEMIQRLGEELGGRGEGTKFVARNGRYTGAFDGPICEGEGKRQRALSIAKELGCDPALCYAYGDTASDIPFLAAFGHPCAVDPDEALEAEAKRRGWEVLRSARREG